MKRLSTSINWGVDDKCELIDLSAFDYKDYTQLMKKVAANLWKNAQSALKVAKKI